jgi:hypothetical protein
MPRADANKKAKSSRSNTKRAMETKQFGYEPTAANTTNSVYSDKKKVDGVSGAAITWGSAFAQEAARKKKAAKKKS